MPSVGFEPAIPANKRPQTYALDRAATRIGFIVMLLKELITQNTGFQSRFVNYKSRNTDLDSNP
jgi:hypothetical protein